KKSRDLSFLTKSGTRAGIVSFSAEGRADILISEFWTEQKSMIRQITSHYGFWNIQKPFSQKGGGKKIPYLRGAIPPQPTQMLRGWGILAIFR
ncbi:MAG: hypothetical protein II715_02600, partial [Clostridia bacterium]|nr:hypothetical protein [Clostridia bacterium]